VQSLEELKLRKCHVSDNVKFRNEEEGGVKAQFAGDTHPDNHYKSSASAFKID
jgi:hypothetical protein